ncbi:MAG: hypothetical protein QXI16_07860 [Sulfolobaceae archaeon]
MKVKVNGLFVGSSVRSGKTKEGKEYVSREITIIPEGEIHTTSIRFDNYNDFENVLSIAEEGKPIELPVNVTTYNNYLYLKYSKA